MKKIMNPSQTQTNKRSIAAKWASAIVCFALMLAGMSAFAQPANDDFANAITISGSTLSQNGTTVDATRQTGDPADVAWPTVGNTTRRSPAGDRSVWYLWTAPSTGTFTVKTLGKVAGTTDDLDTQLGVYTGTLGSLSEVASSEDAFDGANDNFLGAGQSQLDLNAVSGTQYAIMVNGFNSIAGTFTLSIAPGGGTVVTGLVLTVTTTGAGTVDQSPAQPAEGYASNAVVTLTANPTGTNTFTSWGGDIGTNLATANPITIVMDSNKAVSAAFTGTGGGGGGTNLTLTIQKIGAGTVTKSPNKARYNEGEVVTVVARPAGSRTFIGWTGTDESNSDRTNHVTMTSDKTITAEFSGTPGPTPVPGEFDGVVGTYNGLFFNPEVSTNCSGYFTAKISKKGKLTVRLNKGGKTLSGSGQINSTTGVGVATIGKGANLTTVTINTDVTGADPAVTGIVTTPDCIATLEGDRAVFSSKNPSPIQGLFTFILPRNVIAGGQTNEEIITNIVVVTNDPGTTNETFVTNTTFTTNLVVSTNDVVVNPGHSFATLSINKAGKAKIKGTMADGTKFSQNTTISTNGEIPLFASFFRGNGLLLGWLNVTQLDVSGNPINWRRPAGESGFPAGFDADITAFGSRFSKEINPFLVLGTNAVLVIDRNAGPLVASETRVIPVEFSADNTLVEKGGTGTNSTDSLSLKLQPSGLVKGKFTSALTGETTKLQGAMIQNTNAAFGYFLTDDTSGSFELRNEPVVEVVPETIPEAP